MTADLGHIAGAPVALTDPRVIGLGTHHKTGTVWMQRVFRSIGRALSIPCAQVFRKTAEELVPETGRVILFSWSSRFHPSILARGDARILHMIRDPRDVLISGMRYHQRAGTFGEKAVHTPREDLGGKTYQEHIRALGTEEEKLLFEMRERHARTLSEMLAWTYGRPNVIDMRYEDLIVDEEATLFRKVLAFLGLSGPEVERGARIFWRKSLFGGLAEDAARDDRIRLHVASGQVAQWRRHLPRRVAEIYADRHGQDLVALGYERHPTAWLGDLCHDG